MKIGAYTVTEVIWGTFKLDGGSMFGSVPKNLWARAIPADEQNRIPLICRSLRIEDGTRNFLIDVGLGDKWNEKSRLIYDISNISKDSWGFNPSTITDIILTHLHFDHAGGISTFGPSETGARPSVELAFPQARIHLQRANWDRARSPSLKDRASYLAENITPLEHADLRLYDHNTEIAPGITVHRVDGHTPGQQWVEIASNDQKIFFATDLIPTAHHVPLPYHMGYDVCADTLLLEKENFLERATSENALLCFQHDRDTALARIARTKAGAYEVVERWSQVW